MTWPLKIRWAPQEGSPASDSMDRSESCFENRVGALTRARVHTSKQVRYVAKILSNRSESEDKERGRGLRLTPRNTLKNHGQEQRQVVVHCGRESDWVGTSGQLELLPKYITEFRMKAWESRRRKNE